MKVMAVTLVLGSAAAFPATSYLQQADIDAAWTSDVAGYVQRVKNVAGWISTSADAADAGRYVTAPVKAEELVKTIMATGSLIPALNVEVGSVLSGQISKLRVDFNDKVKKGQVLAELDDRTYALAADASRAAMEAAKSEIGSFEARLKRSILDLWQSEHQLPVFTARVDNARIALETAERDYNRKVWLQERNAAAAMDVQNTQSRRDGLAATLREAEANLGNQNGMIASARADVEKARADLASSQATAVRLEALWRSASVDLERTKVTSPVEGVIVGRNITEGQTLATGLEAKTLFVIAGDLEHMEINTRVDESDIARIKDGQNATFTVDAFPGRTFSAIVKQIRMAPQVVSNVVTYTVVLKTDNPGGVLLPGMTVLASIETHRTASSMTVPMSALRYKPRTQVASRENEAVRPSDSVWVLRDGKPVLLAVVKGEEDGKNVVVKSEGLRPTDLVILRNKDAAAERGGS
jgi:HlyD family secretion protein